MSAKAGLVAVLSCVLVATASHAQADPAIVKIRVAGESASLSLPKTMIQPR